MEAQAALVGADGGVELAAVAAVHLDLALVVHPGHAEADHPVRLHQTLQNAVFLQLRVLLHIGLQGVEHFINSLQEFLIGGISGRSLVVNGFHIGIGQHDSTASFQFRFHNSDKCSHAPYTLISW